MMRTTAAVAVLVSAATHLFMWLDWAREDAFLGPSFLLNAVGGLLIAAMVLRWQHWIPALLVLGFGLSTLAAFVTATTVGLFGVTATWAGWEVWVAAASEVVAIVVGAVLLAGQAPWRSHGQPQDHATVRRPHLHR